MQIHRHNAAMAYLVSHPDEVRVVSERFGKARRPSTAISNDGYKAVQKRSA